MASTIARYMTRQPWTVRRNVSLKRARAIMKEHDIRHLPVLEGDELIGLLSERDILLVERLLGVESETTVADAMSVDVMTAAPDSAVEEVADSMADHKYGCSVIVDEGGAVEGIFTTVDALRVLADAMRHEPR
jgi:acetoin utilization protein AcuB